MAEQALSAPKAENNPWRVDDMKTIEERLQIAQFLAATAQFSAALYTGL